MPATDDLTASPTSTRTTTSPFIGWLLIAAVAMLPAQFELTDEFRLAPTDLFVAAYLGFRLPSLRHVARAWSSWHLAVFIMVFFGAAVGFIATGAVSSFAFPNKLVGIAQLFAIVFAILDYARTFGDVALLARTFIGSTTVVTAASIVILNLQSSGTVELSMFNLDAARLSGLIVDPNAMGGLIGTALALLLVTAASGRSLLSRNVTLVSALILAVGLFLTYSRGAWLGFGLGMTAGVILLRGQVRRRLGLMLLLGITAGGAVFLTSGEDSSVTRLTARGDQAAERVNIAGDAFDEYVSSPLFGTGLGAHEAQHGQQIHNTALWFLTEMGPIGMASIVGLFVIMTQWALRSARTASGPVAALAGAALIAHLTMFGVSMGFEALYQRHWWFIWAIIGWCHAFGEPTEQRPQPVLRAEIVQ